MILVIGEILVDMIGNNQNGITTFERYPGGAPFNACCGANNLCGKAGFIGAVGDDLNGHFLIDYVNSLNLRYKDIYVDSSHNTTIAFVENGVDGERSFSFNRKNTADYHIPKTSLQKIKDADIVVLGSLMLSEKEGKNIADEVVKLAKKYNKPLSFDVNYRDDIFKSKEEAIKTSLKYVQKANIVKFAEEEVLLLSGEKDVESGIKKITADNQLVLVTLGKNGSRFYYKGMTADVATIKVNSIDTTGAGDAFYSCVLAELNEKDIYTISKNELINILKKANICGALACTKKGAINKAPTDAEFEKYLSMIK